MFQLVAHFFYQAHGDVREGHIYKWGTYLTDLVICQGDVILVDGVPLLDADLFWPST